MTVDVSTDSGEHLTGVGPGGFDENRNPANRGILRRFDVTKNLMFGGL
jgi:hypothetical protein